MAGGFVAAHSAAGTHTMRSARISAAVITASIRPTAISAVVPTRTAAVATTAVESASTSPATHMASPASAATVPTASMLGERRCG